jgi:folate-dependent phosphoribosylglycinamide formyltransferase PurN
MLLENKKWVAFFSHTGNEIYNVSKAIGRFPDRIVTNNPPDSKHVNKKLLNKVDVVYTRDRPDEEDYDRVIWTDSIVTLHGWMRIVPKRICKDYEIYNLHPGLISKYPELKGADPQDRIYNSTKTYKDVGCVIHKVTSKLDAGKILFERSTFNHYPGKEMLTKALHEIAGDMWKDFLTLNYEDFKVK